MPPVKGSVTQATAEKAFQAAAGLADDAETQVVLFSGKDPLKLEAQRLNPTESLADDFRATASKFARQVASKRTPVAYNAGRTPADYEIAYLGFDRLEALHAILDQVEEPVNLELFDPASRAASTLRFYIVAFRSRNAGWIHFFRSKGPALRLKRTKKVLAVMKDAVYDELEEDPLVFDATFDAILSDNVALVVNQGAFTRSIGFVAEAQELAHETLTELSKTLDISNLDEFRTAASSDINMIGKVRSIAEKMAANPAYASAMTTERVIQFATDNDIEIDVEEFDGKKKFVFHRDLHRRWRILRLLDDDYLHSQLTELDYEVNSKSPL
jgi:Kiwa protein KwaB-like